MPNPITAWLHKRRVAAAVATLKRTDKREWWAAMAGAAGATGYAGGAVNRLTQSMAAWSGALNAQNDVSLPALRARARSLVANTDFGKRYVSMVADNVVGCDGPELQVRATNAKGKLDRSANDAVENHWDKWGEVCDATGRQHFEGLLRVAIQSVATDGEVFVRKYRGADEPYGMSLRLFEADRCPHDYNKTLTDGARVRQGVEFDARGRPVAYWLYTDHPGETYGARVRELERVPASDIYHIFMHDRPEQVRGVTWFHAVLLRAQHLHEFQDAAVIAARVGASKVGFFKRSEDSVDMTATLASGGTGAPSSPLTMSAEPGEFTELPPGYDLADWNPEYPHQNFESFVKQCMRGIASGLNVATHNLSGDMTDVNYSSARIAELAERGHWEALQDWLMDALMEPLYAEWLAGALLLGQITMDQGTPLPARTLQKLVDAAEFRGRTWGWVDPLKESEADVLRLKNGLTSRTELAVRAGREFDDILAELADEQAQMKAAGIVLDPAAAAAAAPAPPPAPPANNNQADLVKMLGKMGDMLGTMARTLEIKAAEPPAPVHVVVEQADSHIHLHPAPARTVERTLVTDESGEPVGVIEREIAPTAPGVH
jgi:lambda family phage portal protein